MYAPQGQPFSCAHLRTSRCPPRAAVLHVAAFQRHPFSRAHLRSSRWPPRAALLQVRLSQGQPLARSHLRQVAWQPRAAAPQVHSSQRQPLARAHSMRLMKPSPAAWSQYRHRVSLIAFTDRGKRRWKRRQTKRAGKRETGDEAINLKISPRTSAGSSSRLEAVRTTRGARGGERARSISSKR